MKGTLRKRLAFRFSALAGVVALLAALLAAWIGPLPAFLLSLAAGVAGAFLLAERLTAPLRRLARAAGPYAGGTSDRLPPRLSDGDEVDVLTGALEELGTMARAHGSGREREARQLRQVLETMIEGVLVIGPDGRVSLDNAAFRTLLSGAAAAAGRTPIEALRSPAFDEAVRSVMTGGAPQVFDLSVGAADDPAAAPPRADAPPARRTFRVSLAPLALGEGRGAVAVFHDITRVRELERLRQDFVANVSHELRTPLAAIKGYVETLREGDVPPADRARFLDTVARHTDRLANLIEDLLELSRLESPQAKLEIAPLPLAAAAAKAVQLMEGAARQRRVELADEVPDRLPLVVADPRGLEQVLVNLLDNAIKYTPAGGRVTVSAARQDGGVRVTVADTGVGVPAGDLPRLFERFYRVDAGRSREQGGTGLGLAIVKHLVALQGGQVGVESAVGRGSTFWFTLRSAGPGEPGGAELPAGG